MNIYVGNLPFKTGDNDLRALFERFGEVISSKVIVDKMTGRSRGFGFVEMSDTDGRNAIQEMDGKEHEGRNLKVNEAQPRERDDRGGGGGGGGGRGGRGGYGGGGGGRGRF